MSLIKCQITGIFEKGKWAALMPVLGIENMLFDMFALSDELVVLVLSHPLMPQMKSTEVSVAYGEGGRIS